MKYSKVLIDYSDGQYFATPLVEQDLTKYSPGHCIVEVPEDKLKEWEQHNTKDREWNKYWNELSNQFIENFSEPNKKCEHEYLPDEDGTVYHCGDEDNVRYLNGYFYCPKHIG
jgi:hypothetical protein